MIVRPAVPSDCDAIAALHSLSWRSTYRDILSDDYLDREVLRRGKDRAGGGNAVHLGHPHVHEDEVRRQLCRGLDRCPAVRDLADHLEVRLRAQHHAEPAADQGLVVGDQHPDHGVRHAVNGSEAVMRQPRPSRAPALRWPP